MRGNTGVLCSCCNLFPGCSKRDERERFLKFTGQTSTAVTFGTFHGVFYGILKQAYGLGAGNILSEEEKYDILKEMTLEFGQELAQEGDFQEDVAKEISVVKGGGFPWITIILPAARMRYSARFIMGIRRLCAREEKTGFR